MATRRRKDPQSTTPTENEVRENALFPYFQEFVQELKNRVLLEKDKVTSGLEQLTSVCDALESTSGEARGLVLDSLGHVKSRCRVLGRSLDALNRVLAGLNKESPYGFLSQFPLGESEWGDFEHLSSDTLLWAQKNLYALYCAGLFDPRLYEKMKDVEGRVVHSCFLMNSMACWAQSFPKVEYPDFPRNPNRVSEWLWMMGEFRRRCPMEEE